MTPADRLRLVGEALYGPSWQRQMGRAIGKDERQVRRWVSGEYEPPTVIWAILAGLCRAQSVALSSVARELRAFHKCKQTAGSPEEDA